MACRIPPVMLCIRIGGDDEAACPCLARAGGKLVCARREDLSRVGGFRSMFYMISVSRYGREGLSDRLNGFDESLLG